MNLLPTATVFARHPGVCVLPDGVTLDVPDEDPDAGRVARAVSRCLGIHTVRPGSDFVIRWSAGEPYTDLEADEGYTLRVAPEGITVEAASGRGALHAISSLAQLVVDGEVPCVRVEDSPAFAWRGLMLDPARRFLPLACLEDVIDGMSQLKLNVLHLHLSDDQGFVFESKSFPRLASRVHYTQAQLRALVDFAAERGVCIVPEIDMPGHVTSWLVAYPEWGNREVGPSTRFGVHPGCLNPTDERVYAAIEVLLGEVCSVFPGRFIHIGGDEVHSSWWRDDPGIRAFMAARGLADTTALQALFNRRVVAMLQARGRTVIGWDEVLHPDLPPDVVVQGWRGALSRDRALAAGHDCIVSSGHYLDLFYPGAIHRRYRPDLDEATLLAQEDALLADERFAHVAQGMRWTHAWRQVPPVDRQGRRGTILGGEACLWGELVDGEVLDGRLWSRLPDIAECFWAAEPEADDAVLRGRWPALVHMRLARNRARLLRAVGDDPEALEGAQLCEPVKWYARLLGEVALNARIRGTEMPQARPYGTQTALDRPVDFLLPESLDCRDIRTWPTATLATACARWARLDRLAAAPAELHPVFAVIAAAARTWLDCLAGDLSREEATRILGDSYQPCGEYLPAIVPVLRDRLA